MTTVGPSRRTYRREMLRCDQRAVCAAIAQGVHYPAGVVVDVHLGSSLAHWS